MTTPASGDWHGSWCPPDCVGAGRDAAASPASAEPTEVERMIAIVQAADNLSFMVTSYLLGDLDAATVQRALEAYSAARTQEVPF